MVNARTLQALYQALLDCVPGKAQRARLLAALARAPGNRTVSEAMSALQARDGEMGLGLERRPGARVPPPPRSGVRAKLVTWSQSPPEVQVTMSRETAQVLERALAAAAWNAEEPCFQGKLAAQELQGALLRALDRKAG